MAVAKRGRSGNNILMRCFVLIAGSLSLLTACSVAKTAVDVAMVPVHVATAGVNAVLPNQKKADEKRGRELRKEDEERGKQLRMAQDRCRRGKALPTDDCAPVAQR